MDTSFSPELLLEGAVFALEQAGLLLRDAALLYRNHRWATALAVSVFCIEELGKSALLLESMRMRLQSKPITREMLIRTYIHHKRKLRYGRSIYSVAADMDFWGEPPDLDSPKWPEFLQRMDEADRAELKRTPHTSHIEKLNSLYVHFSEDLSWNRPKDTSPRSCYDLVSAAAIEYELRRHYFVRPADPVEERLLASMGGWLRVLPKPVRIRPPRS